MAKQARRCTARSKRSGKRCKRAPIRGGTVFGIWPLNRYRRIELVGGVLQYREEFNDPGLQQVSE